MNKANQSKWLQNNVKTEQHILEAYFKFLRCIGASKKIPWGFSI